MFKSPDSDAQNDNATVPQFGILMICPPLMNTKLLRSLLYLKYYYLLTMIATLEHNFEDVLISVESNWFSEANMSYAAHRNEEHHSN